MKYMKHIITGLAIFVLIVSLNLTTYTSLEEAYSITRTNDVEGKNIMEMLNELTILQGIQEFTDSIYELAVPGNTLLQSFEVLTGAALGIFKILVGVVLFPLQIMNVVLLFYLMPPILVTILNVIIITYIGFILFKHWLKME